MFFYPTRRLVSKSLLAPNIKPRANQKLLLRNSFTSYRKIPFQFIRNDRDKGTRFYTVAVECFVLNLISETEILIMQYPPINTLYERESARNLISIKTSLRQQQMNPRRNHKAVKMWCSRLVHVRTVKCKQTAINCWKQRRAEWEESDRCRNIKITNSQRAW